MGGTYLYTGGVATTINGSPFEPFLLAPWTFVIQVFRICSSSRIIFPLIFIFNCCYRFKLNTFKCRETDFFLFFGTFEAVKCKIICRPNHTCVGSNGRKARVKHQVTQQRYSFCLLLIYFESHVKHEGTQQRHRFCLILISFESSCVKCL